MERGGDRLRTINQRIQPQSLIKYESCHQLLTVTLNRPKALNSLNLSMINDLASNLKLMNQHQVIWLQGAGGKSFCAGGDVKVLFEPQSTIADRLTFFRNEFTLDYSISQLKAVQISCWDGIVMGGGVGLSVFAPVIIATQNTVFAMPQTKLGFFTDVGATYILSRMRNNIGYYLGLTGKTLKGEDVFIAGLAHFYIKSKQLPEAYRDISDALKQKVSDPQQVVQNILRKYHAASGRTEIEHEQQIKAAFSLASGLAIYDYVSGVEDDFHMKTAIALKQVCPTSIELVCRMIRKAKSMTLKECFIQDFMVIEHMVVSPDFKEGVRCVLKEKGVIPKWSCPELKSLKEYQVEKYLKPISWSEPLYLD